VAGRNGSDAIRFCPTNPPPRPSQETLAPDLADGFPAHSFQTLLADWQRAASPTSCIPEISKATVHKTPNHSLQARVYALVDRSQ